MITLIHGEDIVNSRKYFLEEKEKYKDTITLEGESISKEEVIQTLEGNGLFSTEKNIFIDQLLSKRKPSKELEEIINLINLDTTINIFIWESKELTKKQTSQFKNTNIRLFAYPNILFTFLDSLRPNNTNNIVKLFNDLNKNVAEELIIFMLIRQFRLLLAVSNKTTDNIDEIKRMAPWQEDKLKKQASYFANNQLVKIYKRLSEIDLGLKTGSLGLTPRQVIDFLLLEI